MTDASRRWPAEWEAQDAVVIAWPHQDTDWGPWLEAVLENYVALSRAILAHQRLIVLCASPQLAADCQARVGAVGARAPETLIYDYDDTWLRDSGPISVQSSDGWTWLDFRFTGWGDKFSATRDDGIVAFLAAQPLFSVQARERFEFALEGGAIETDGAGTLLSTWTCLSRRHPGKSRAEVQSVLAAALSLRHFLWLDSGELTGDDTDAHIDTLARFASPDTIVFQGCRDTADAHYLALSAMATELHALRDRDGQPYRCVELPFAPPIYAVDGRRLAASYANFLIVNGAVLMPGYDVETDAAAASALAAAFPAREIVVVPCRALIEQNGSLHCVTMQLPEGSCR